MSSSSLPRLVLSVFFHCRIGVLWIPSASNVVQVSSYKCPAMGLSSVLMVTATDVGGTILNNKKVT